VLHGLQHPRHVTAHLVDAVPVDDPGDPAHG
jgi:hypothetical protein